MSNERENFNGSLKFVDYDISGNYLRAYYDADGKLVFVLDFAISDTKPNVLLVINPVGIRKWDDILTNDYGVDLEDVRPKKDNKYQKLDIEYSGLGVYDALFRAYVAGNGIDGAIGKLVVFRNMASRNAAFERLGAADVMAKNARETIEKTKETIKELQERLKNLRAKLATQRKDIGKEPTKQSASKILRTEAQIDAINEKMARAKKRLASAQRRLVAAEDDADVARDILDALLADDTGIDNATDDVALPAMPASTDVVVSEPAPVPMNVVPEFTDLTTETKAEDMADEEVKPLFDEDPEILDEDIAFKPIDFNANKTTQTAPVVTEKKTETVQPLSFVPPVGAMQGNATISAPATADEPVLNSLTTVPAEQIDSELMSTIDIPGFSDVPDIPTENNYIETEEKADVTAPVAPVPGYAEPTVQEIVEESVPTPMPEIEVSPTTPETRPVSPITGVTSPVTAVRRKPTMLYYILLIVLIVLSVFTLWFYQKSAPDTAMPVLEAQVEAVEEKSDVTAEQADTKETEDVAEEKTDEPSPFIDLTVVDNDSSDNDVDVQEADAVEPVADEAEEKTEIEDATPIVEPSAEEVAAVSSDDVDFDAAVFPDIEPVAVQVAPEPVKSVEDVVAESENSESPFLSDEVVAPAETKSVAEIIAAKPVYNVSQQENMFVADDEYETDATDVVAEEVVIDAPVVDYSEPMVVGATEIVEEEQQMCSDGNAPDMNGCCAGENFMDGLCCAEGTGECFEPMI